MAPVHPRQARRGILESENPRERTAEDGQEAAGAVTDTIETIKPYLDRALTDPEFRDDLKDALEAARELYGPLTKGNGNVSVAAKRLATDKKAQKQVKRAVEDLQRATATLQGKKKGKKRGRKMVLLAGIIVGALYNPWTGPQTRDWLLDQIAGSDDLAAAGRLRRRGGRHGRVRPPRP